MSSFWEKLPNLMVAALVGIVVLFVSVGFVSKYFDESERSALIAVATLFAAIGTVGALSWAIYRQAILTWLQRPKLEISSFEIEPPHLRRVTGYDPKTRSQICILYPLSIQLKNTGRTIAKSAQPLVTGMGRVIDGKWRTQKNWISAPIRWALDVPAEVGTETPTQEKDLVSYRPYVFNFGLLRTDDPNLFILNTIVMPGNQEREYGPGEFCFELTVFAEGADPAIKYFRIQWNGGCSEDFEEVRSRIKIEIKDDPPW